MILKDAIIANSAEAVADILKSNCNVNGTWDFPPPPGISYKNTPPRQPPSPPRGVPLTHLCHPGRNNQRQGAGDLWMNMV